MSILRLLPILFLLWATPSWAALIGDADQPYRATRTVVADGHTYVGTMRSAPGMQRHDQEVNGIRFTLILRADRDVAWLLLPDFSIYAELPLSDTLTRYGDRASLGPARGVAEIGGISAGKYRLRHKDQSGAVADGFLWMTGSGMVVKLEGSYTAPHGHRTLVTVTLSHIQPGPQDSSYFSIPDGMHLLPPEAVAGLMGIDPKTLPQH